MAGNIRNRNVRFYEEKKLTDVHGKYFTQKLSECFLHRMTLSFRQSMIFMTDIWQYRIIRIWKQGKRG